MNNIDIERFEKLVERFENSVYMFHSAMNELRQTIREQEDGSDDWKKGDNNE